MKFIFIFGLISVCLHVTIAKIVSVSTEMVAKNPVPEHGECFRNTRISCSQAGEPVKSSSAQYCYKCICDGDGMGATCCTKAAFPIVKSPMFCMVHLDTATCTYKRTPIKVLRSLDKHACCIEGYFTSIIERDNTKSKKQ